MQIEDNIKVMRKWSTFILQHTHMLNQMIHTLKSQRVFTQIHVAQEVKVIRELLCGRNMLQAMKPYFKAHFDPIIVCST